MGDQVISVSQKIRDALQASLPAAPDQLLTIQSPGTALNCSESGPFWWNPSKHAETPYGVKVSEARLTDGMVPLSKVMRAPTGQSVAHSYNAALDMLIPEDPFMSGGTMGPGRTSGAERYASAMKFLSSKDRDTDMTVMDVYTKKQQAWIMAASEWEQAQKRARGELLRRLALRWTTDLTLNVSLLILEDLKQWHPLEPKMFQQLYLGWLQENSRDYKDRIQAKYMDCEYPSTNASAQSRANNEANAKASESASRCDVDISFEALVVEINRSWLHGELFADSELNVPGNVHLSPGPQALIKAIDGDGTGLEQYSCFPSYPTSFVIAANVELEFRGDTAPLEEALASSSHDVYSKDPATLLGGLVLNPGVTNDNFYSMIEIVLIITGTYVLQDEAGEILSRDAKPLLPGKYFVVADDKIEVSDEVAMTRTSSPDTGTRIQVFRNQCNFGHCITLPPSRGGVINSVQNGLLLRSDIRQVFDRFNVAINPDDNHKIISFQPNAKNVSGTFLEPSLLNDERRPAPELLRWHFRQAVLTNMRGAGEPVFEHDFPPGSDMMGR
ncbi:unnamed protein product [Parascedosporium putredinis]|uniref:HNH nuclease domain-containing protein n=1 Tax=Parascedosporium putredinis TaxID=1442378 RepID=A0A9P1H381_9PEZI|nr:unnamed protein product [Parascedosporium putredinis]CAI7996741.1 unnamed protein product [Parascedosporium putredinis]